MCCIFCWTSTASCSFETLSILCIPIWTDSEHPNQSILSVVPWLLSQPLVWCYCHSLSFLWSKFQAILWSKHDCQLLFQADAQISAYSRSKPWMTWNFQSCLHLKTTCLCNASLFHVQWFPTSSYSMLYHEISSLFEIPSSLIVL